MDPDDVRATYLDGDGDGELIRMAKEGGAEQNYFFTTAFEKYQMQLDIMEELQGRIARIRTELQSTTIPTAVDQLERRLNAAVSEYNKTATASNNTITTLLKIIVTFAEGSVMKNASEDDKLDL